MGRIKEPPIKMVMIGDYLLLFYPRTTPHDTATATEIGTVMIIQLTLKGSVLRVIVGGDLQVVVELGNT